MTTEMSTYSGVYAALGQLSFVRELHEQHLSYLHGLEHVLDAGCGPGLLTTKIAPIARHVMGIDMNKDMIAHAVPIVGSAKNVTLMVGDVCHLPFADGTFDGYVSNNVLHFISDYERFFSEMMRITKPGATITLSSAKRGLDMELLINGIFKELHHDVVTAHALADSNRKLMLHVKTLLEPSEAGDLMRQYGCRVIHQSPAYLDQSFFVAGARL